MTERLRRSSRILVFDREGSILMFLTTGDNGLSRWLTPGGGVDPGETHAEGAVRELFEETGVRVESLGEPVFTYDFAATYGALDHDIGHAEYYAIVVDRFEPSNANWTDDEKIDVLAHRWWSLDDIESTTEPFEPPMLAELVRANRR